MARSGRSTWGLVAAASIALGASLARAGGDDPDPPNPLAPQPVPPPAPPAAQGGDEPELTGEAKAKHDADVKAILADLRSEKNLEIVRGKIQRLGAEGRRAGRDALIVYATGNKNQEFAAETFRALAKVGGKVAVEFLCGKVGLRSADFLVAQSAADALATAKNPLAVAPLLDVMTAAATKAEVVGSCAKAVAQTAPADEKVAEALFALGGHRKDTIRSYALEAIGYLGTDRAMKRLETALFEDKNGRARQSAAVGMQNSGRRDMIPVLERRLKDETAFQVKDAVQTAIRKLSGG